MADVAAIRVESVRCVGFRGLEGVEITLHPQVTVLVGRNNAGKSRLLRAIALAMGAVPADRDDLTVDGPRQSHVDVVLAPANADSPEAFDARVGPLLQTGSRQTVSEEPLRERISWRTSIARSAEGFSAETARHLRRWDNSAGDWVTTGVEVGRDLLRLCRAHLIETGRDLATELRQRGSAAHRLMDDLELYPEVVDELQAQLDSLSSAIVSGSRTFQDVGSALRELASHVDAVGDPLVRPVPGRVNDLSAVASIELVDGSGQGLPLRMHGTGARSLASLRLQGVLYERRLGAGGGDVRPHALTLIEEPEAHLHPQAQLDLPRLLDSIPGQVVVSTHSTHLVSEVEQDRLRILTPVKGGLRITTLESVADPPEGTPRQLDDRFYVSEMEKLRRCVERPFGELLFASAVVMGDGATERSILPIVLRHALATVGHGLCVIDPGSMNDPAAIAALKAARLFGIPWFLFADGDVKGTEAVEAIVTQLKISAEEREKRVVQVPEGATEQMFADFDPSLCHAALAAMKPGTEPIADAELVKELGRVKGSVGRYLGIELITKHPVVASWPAPLGELVERIKSHFEPSAVQRTPGDTHTDR